jgi:hypothetical protein
MPAKRVTAMAGRKTSTGASGRTEGVVTVLVQVGPAAARLCQPEIGPDGDDVAQRRGRDDEDVCGSTDGP